MATSSGQRQLDQTATWSVAGVCAIIVLISIVLEKVLHKLGTWFTERHKRAMFEALEKVKAELMVLGFISLILTFGQSYISKICIPMSVADTMLPCPSDGTNDATQQHRRRRLLASVSNSTNICAQGKEPLISSDGLHQIHILIFFLAVFHVIYSLLTMMLGRLKIRGWKKWEQETMSEDSEFSNDPARFRLTHQTSFVRGHTSFWTRIPLFFYVGCFFRQFFRSVSRADYLTLRNGFITVHLAPGSKFNFQKYIKRSLEDDFKLVVGVSPLLWASFVVFLLLNVNGWKALLWASLVPVIIILAVGAELQRVLTKMALEISEKHAVVQGIPLVQGSDKYFWFGRPHLVLHLIHFALFQNAFQITYFFWIWYTFGINSCFHADFTLALIKVGLGIGVLIMCTYSTLPLYALVTQMGSRMKKSIFDEQTSKALKNWQMAAKKRQGGKSPTRDDMGGSSPTPSPFPGSIMHRPKTTNHSDYEAGPLSPTMPNTLYVKVDHIEQPNEMMERHSGEETRNEDDFSFAKPAPNREP